MKTGIVSESRTVSRELNHRCRRGPFLLCPCYRPSRHSGYGERGSALGHEPRSITWGHFSPQHPGVPSSCLPAASPKRGALHVNSNLAPGMLALQEAAQVQSELRAPPCASASGTLQCKHPEQAVT